MEENVNQQIDEMIEIGVVKCYTYEVRYGEYKGRNEYDCVLFVKYINGLPILLVDLNDKLRVVEIGIYQKWGDEYNGKVGYYFINIPSTVINLLNASTNS